MDAFLHIAFGLYIADFFLMPFACGRIDIEKLPFHICTAMCVACFISRHNRHLRKYSLHFALLGFLSNLVYLIYPDGVMGGPVRYNWFFVLRDPFSILPESIAPFLMPFFNIVILFAAEMLSYLLYFAARRSLLKTAANRMPYNVQL